MLLGIDLGTGSAKALLMTVAGEVIAEASSPYLVKAPQPGWAESEPEQWWSAVAIAVRAAVQGNAEQVQAIGLSGQMHGVVLTDQPGNPLRPAILWADTRSSKMLSVYRQLPPELHQQLGNPIAAGMAGASLLWLRDYEPGLYGAARWALQPKDWLRLRLTGEVATEPSDASGTLLYDVCGDRWAVDVIAALHLRSDWLPELISSSQIAGNLTKDAAHQLGLKADIPVVAGAADTAAAALGSGLVKPGFVQLTIGSGAQIASLRSQPILDPYGRTHLYRAALPDQWYTLAAIQNAGLALEWARTILGMSWAQVYAEAFSVPPGCEGLTFLPYLTGDRTPHLNPDARGAWIGLGLHHTQTHLIRSALEGVAFALRQGVAAITATGITISELRLAGGGTLEPAWRQLLADVLQVPLHNLPVIAASARGAAILAGIGVGVCGMPQFSASSQAQIGQTSKAKMTQITSPQQLDPQLETAWKQFCILYPQLHPPS